MYKLTMAFLAVAAAMVHSADPTRADSFPSGTVTMIVPFAAGGSNDILARYVSEQLGKMWGQAVVVENRPGAGSAIGSNFVARSKPDGQTLLVVSNAFTMNPAIQSNLPFDSREDFVPVAMLSKGQLVLATGSSSKATNLKDFVTEAKDANFKFATAGLGSVPHFAGELLNSATGLKLVAVHYQGSSQPLVDLVGGNVDAYFASTTRMLQLVRDDRVKALAITGPTRSSAAPDIPTFAEAGFPAAGELVQWWGILAPADTPDETIAKINADVNSVMTTEASREFLANDGGEPNPMSPAEMQSFMEAEFATWTELAASAGITQ